MRDQGPRRLTGERWEGLKTLAREMRHKPTPAEDALWQALRDRQVAGIKFRRQHVFDPFIVDFYAAEVRLVVEADGPIHERTPEQDALRVAYLESLGLIVLRFTNDAILTNLPHVLAQIHAALLRTPSPQGGEGVGGEDQP